MTRIIAERYRLDQHLTSINHSEFYNGFDTQSQQPVIVRLIDLEQGDEKTRAKLQRFMANENNMQTMQTLTHPSVLQTLDYGQEGTTYYQINELADFKTLRDEITRNPCDIPTSLRYGRDLASIMAELHAIDIIHCDIKPENILVTDNGLKLIEFSIANHVLPEGHATGTPSYMSPEAVAGANPAPARDVWSLGVTLYELITGTLPYPMPTGENGYQNALTLMTNIAHEPVPPIESRISNLPPRLVSLFEGMLEKDPAKRIKDMNLVTSELNGILSQFSVS